jgi:hypothetical protein
MPALAGLLRGIHGDVGVAEELVRGADVCCGLGEPGARVNGDLPASKDKRGRKTLDDTIRDALRVGHADVLEEDSKLVAAEARRDVLRAHELLKTTCHGSNQLVAGSMPEAVVDRLEVVEIEKEHGGGMPARGAVKRSAYVFGEEDPVRKAGQRVVERLMSKLLLELSRPSREWASLSFSKVRSHGLRTSVGPFRHGT